MPRPNLSQEVVDRMNRTVEEIMAVEPESVSFERRLGVLLDELERRGGENGS